MPKRCGHLSGKRLAPPEVLAEKVYALKRLFPTLIVVARTDARESEGIEGVIERARLYVEAGADIIFPEALESLEEFQAVREALSVPLLANLTEFGKTPLFSAEAIFALGYEIALFPVSALRVAAKAMEEFYEHLSRHGSSQEYLSRMQTRAELYALIRYRDYEYFDHEVARRLSVEGPGQARG